jgi:hypothetical protein
LLLLSTTTELFIIDLIPPHLSCCCLQHR